VSMCAGLTVSRSASAQTNNQVKSESPSSKTGGALDRYAIDLTRQALQRKLETVDGFEGEISRVIAMLSGSVKAPLVISQSDVDRGMIARGVALKIAFGDVPENLRGKTVYSLSLDALAKDAGNSQEFEQRLQAVLANAEAASSEVILFIDQLHQYAGARATAFASAAVKSAIERRQLRVIAGSSPEAYAAYIAVDDTVAKLFDSISIDRTGESANTSLTPKDKRRSPINEEFEGEKISSDMRDLMQHARNGKVTAILQVDDVNSKEVRSLLARHAVLVSDGMAKLGAMKVDLPVRAIEALARSNSINYISPDRRMESFGHVTATTGADQVRNAPGLLSGLLGSSAIDGTGIGIAVLDSGIDNQHAAFFNTSLLPTTRIKFSKDFTAENNATTDPYGHGSHVAG